MEVIKINKREIKILEILLKSEDDINIKELSQILEVSDRSIRYDIENINFYLKKVNLSPIEKKSKGFLDYSKIDIKKLLFYTSDDNENFYNQYREELILIKIAFEENINISNICEEFNLSRSTIKITLKNNEKILENYELKLILNPQKGLKLSGSEENIRKFQLKLLNQFRFNQENSNYKFDFLKKYISKYFEKIDLNNIKIFINYIINSLGKVISDEAYVTLLNYTVIVIERVRENKTLIYSQNSNFFQHSLEFEIVNKAISLLEVSENIKFNINEIIKFTDYLLGSHSYSISFSSLDNWIEIDILIKKIIIQFSVIAGVNLNDDTILLEGLVNHIKPTVYRIKNKIELENSILEEFLASYSEIFTITKNSLDILEKFLGETIPDSEIAFIGVHFKSALDRCQKNTTNIKNIVIVCGLGYGTSKLMAQQIKNRYNINIVGTIPYYQVEKFIETKNVDMIITNLKNLNVNSKIPVVYIKTLLTNEDFNLLDSYNLPKYNKVVSLSKILSSIKLGAEIFDEKIIIDNLKENFKDIIIDDTTTISKNLSSFLEEKNILLNQKVNTWEEAIKMAGEILIENGYVTPTYIDGMINSIKKNGSYVVVSDLVAIPHAKNENNIYNTGMGLLCLDREVLFPDDVKVKFILAFCSQDNQSHLNAIVQFVDLLKKYNFLSVLEKSTSKKKIMDTIKKYEFLIHFGKNKI
ncbi:MAG: BglG family transcription antiterminator [Fusobacterium perfoetens]|uniref:BglG family transcription antiterminator n=1 Tax=Fusobacterium perfoetens TaxID=852 RepID=UPI0023F0498F|nr:BglG family transcription antiterminator [Fusobacterium perfoetens]MCI6152511.1 BglG family transcription antiterminator [Fusobacterium perfoetens]MDY3237519.1 BglG family transcription antiterminator [Fusobacterium perfoetens]